MAAPKKQPHLSDLFRVGELVTVEDDAGNEYTIYVMRPSSAQMERSREIANGQMGRYKRAVRDPESDISISLRSGLEDADRDQLLEMRAQFEESQVRDNAFNEVVYSDEVGDDWQTDDKYLEMLAALTNRFAEITKYNDEMKELGEPDRIIEDEDEELQRLMSEYDKFQDQVTERADELMARKRLEWTGMTESELRDELESVTVELESKMIWYEAYQIQMLHFACRYSDDQKKLYFRDPDDVREVPQYIRSQLYDAYERLEQGSDDIKNSLSLPSS